MAHTIVSFSRGTEQPRVYKLSPEKAVKIEEEVKRLIQGFRMEESSTINPLSTMDDNGVKICRWE